MAAQLMEIALLALALTRSVPCALQVLRHCLEKELSAILRPAQLTMTVCQTLVTMELALHVIVLIPISNAMELHAQLTTTAFPRLVLEETA